MNAYLFTGLVSHYHGGHFVDGCSSVILCGAEEEGSRRAFEKMLLSRSGGENPSLTRIEKIVSAPMLDQMLTETGPHPITWPEIAEEILRALETTAPDDQEQGYWVDCQQYVRPGNPAPDVAWLQRELPEEVRSGLNWSADKSYLFLISVLRPPAAPAEVVEETSEEDMDDSADSDFEQRLAAFPQLAEKELAAVVRARNSIVATWLWRRHAANGAISGNAIRVDALCDVVADSGDKT